MKILALLSCLVLMPNAWCAGSGGTRRVQGVLNCGSYAEGRASSVKDDWRLTMSMGWIAGYVTAYNLLAPDTYSILGRYDMNTVLAWMDGWCHANPQKTLDDGMLSLVAEAYPARQRTEKAPGTP